MRMAGITLAALLAGCASSALRPIVYAVEDRPDQGRLVLTFRNETRHAKCLLPEHWPNQGGKIDSGAQSVSLVVEGRTFPLKDFNTGYCPGGCATRVASDREGTSFLAYDDFNLPSALRGKPKQLNFRPLAFDCQASWAYSP